jgi:branched-chain amino acid transport system permease protein
MTSRPAPRRSALRLGLLAILWRGLRLLPLLAALLGCSKVDASQAALCERAARLLFPDGAAASLASATDPAVPNGIVTQLAIERAVGGTERHRVSCAFAGGAFSPDRLTLLEVSTDAGAPLDDVHMAILLLVLQREGPPAESWAGALPSTLARTAILQAPLSAGALYFLQQLINGLTLGCVIALIAVGYTLVYSIIGAINFAFGELYMIGAFIAVVAVVFLFVIGVGSIAASVLLALPVAMALTAGYSWVSERLVFRPIRHASSLMPLIAAIGLSIVLQNYVFVAQGARDLWLPPISASGFVLAEADGFSLYLNPQQGVRLAITLALASATWYLLARTPFGRAQRASAQDRGMAALVGINIDRVIAGTFALGGALGAAGGVMVASYYGGVNFVMGFLMGFKALTAAIVGGMGNFAGALLGGFIVALVETFWAGYLQIEYKDIAVFSLLIILLVFRPQGILGER